MTPCKEKGYKVGQIFEVISDHTSFSKGSIIVLAVDDGSYVPRFDFVKGDLEGGCAGLNTPRGGHQQLENVRRIYPPEETKPVETITLMGKEYSKAEIENALKDVMPVDE